MAWQAGLLATLGSGLIETGGAFVAERIRRALDHIDAKQLIVSSDCGFGRQGCNRDIAFFKATAIAQGTNLVRKDLGIETTYVKAADPRLQTDIVPRTATD